MSQADKEQQALMLLHLGGGSELQFHKNGVTIAPPLAFQSQALVRDLLKVGFFSMNIHSMAGVDVLPGAMPGVQGNGIPVALLGMAFHYALDAAPRRAAGKGPEIVEIADLEQQVALIERHFGAIDIDLDLVARVSILAANPALQADLAPRQGGGMS